MKTTPTFILALGTFLFIEPVAHKADAAVMYFAAHWSGVANNNSATATARIGIDTALAPNPGSHVNSAIIPIWFSSITLTISGATSGNGTFTISDFQGMYWNTGGATLDFGRELVGQRTSDAPWGTTNTGSSGDFNVFRADDSLSAPTGTFYFQLTPSRSADILNLVSFLPIPEPTTTVLFIGGATAFLIAARKRRKITSNKAVQSTRQGRAAGLKRVAPDQRRKIASRHAGLTDPAWLRFTLGRNFHAPHLFNRSMKTKLFVIGLVAFTGSALAQTSNVVVTVFNHGEMELTVMVSRETTNPAARLDLKRRIQSNRGSSFEIPQGQYTIKAASYSDEGKILPGTGTTELSRSITNREYWTYRNVKNANDPTIGWKLEIEPRRKM